MSTQPEAVLEAELVQQLHGLGYERVRIEDEAAILSNLKSQLERFNQTTFSEQDFTRILNHLNKGNLFERAKTLRDRFPLQLEDGTVFYVRFFDAHSPTANLWQVTNQVSMQGSYSNRYDVTLLVNGLPLVQIELKRRGLELKEAFNQINRYKRHSFWANSALFQYVQLFVISNGVNTKYYVNNPLISLNYKQTFYWADRDNVNIKELSAFTNAFLPPAHLGRMLGHYVVQNETFKMLMVLRPYQVYAVEAIIERVASRASANAPPEALEGGYIWHTTGSGKTLTSFKASQVIMGLPEVAKVVFVVDRKDLDYQTMKEFNSFKEDSVDSTEDTKGLVKQLGNDTKLIVTTIQKLNNAISTVRHEKKLQHLKDKRVVFIFDECHRSQFGKTHQAITSYFTNAQLFGFTGTPIFAENAGTNELGKRTTKDLFGECLHKYVITDAIRDENVLRFSVEYVGRYKKKDGVELDIEVEDIDRSAVYDDERRLEKIVDHIIANHDRKTHGRNYSALFAVNSIATLTKYYDLFRKKKMAGQHDLRVAALYTYGTNEEDSAAVGALPEELPMAADGMPEYGSMHSRDKLEEIITHYNAQYRTSFNTRDSQSVQNYYTDISKKLKDREKNSDPEQDRIDLVLVVSMMLTGFDAKKVNTLYVDRTLRYHSLIQAYSRTNRIIDEKKSQGNIVAYRNLKKATDDAIALFSKKEAKEVIFLPPYEAITNKFAEAWKTLMGITPNVEFVDLLQDEEQELAFVNAFRALMRLVNVLKTFVEFTWDDLPMSEQEFADYSSKYLELREKARRQHNEHKESILDDVDFEVELIHRDEINVAYILKLLARLKDTAQKDRATETQKLLSMLAGDVELRSKRELIEKFIQENLPHIEDADNIPDEFDRYWQDQKVLALQRLCEEERLDKDQFNKLIEAYIFTGQEPLKEDVFRCLGDRPSVLKAREIGERIIDKMKEFVEVFVRGMVA